VRFVVLFGVLIKLYKLYKLYKYYITLALRIVVLFGVPFNLYEYYNTLALSAARLEKKGGFGRTSKAIYWSHRSGK
jgi:hypothetical protein